MVKVSGGESTGTFSDILRLLRAQADLRGGKIAIESAGVSITHAEVLGRATGIAAGLLSACEHLRGKRPRVGIVLRNGSETAVTLLGAAIAGAALPFNPAYLVSEFELYFQETGLDVLLVSEDETGPAVEAAQRRGLPVLRLSACGGLVGISPDDLELPSPDPDDIALVLLTSGSTGRAKSVPLTHRNLCTSTGDVCRSMGLSEEDRCLAMWEQYHVGGLVDLLLVPLASGGTVICTGGFDAAEFYHLLPSARPTWVQCVPTTLNELLFHASRHGLQPHGSSLRLIRSVASALSPSLKADVEGLFGVPVLQTFGMTEAAPLITSTRLPPAVNKPKSVGFSCGPEIRVLGPNGENLAPDEAGEIAIRGTNVFSGYENDPVANRNSFRDGWFLTGDIGFLDSDGELFLTGRIKQLINRGGEKVNPQEIDDALLSHPAVVEAAAFPVKHRTLGEDVAAAVVLRTPAEPAEIRSFLTSRLASFKIPQRIEIVGTLPRNSIGKIDRRALAEASERAILENRSFAPPRNDLEAFLARLWATELDLEQVGIHDDFATLGGDSLSSLRILVAVEKALDIKTPDGFAALATTVALMAERLGRIECGRDGILTIARSRRIKLLAGLDTKDFLQSIHVGDSGEEDNLDDAYRRLQTCETFRNLNILSDSIKVYATPDELSSLLSRTRGLRLSRPALSFSRLPSLLRLQWARRRWRRQLERELGGPGDGRKWKRSTLSPNAFLYENPDVPKGDKTLIVAFGGNRMRLMMPTYCVLCNLDPGKFDLLLLRDTHHSHYSKGIEAMGDDLDSVSAYLAAYADDCGYRESATLGTSSGGIPALYVGVKNHWARVITVGADRPDSPRHTITSAMLGGLAATSSPGGTDIRLCYSARHRRDRESAALLAKLFPHSTLSGEKGYRSHNLMWRLYQAGELRGFLNRQCSGSE